MLTSCQPQRDQRGAGLQAAHAANACLADIQVQQATEAAQLCQALICQAGAALEAQPG